MAGTRRWASPPAASRSLLAPPRARRVRRPRAPSRGRRRWVQVAGGCAAWTGPVEPRPLGTFPHAPPPLRHGSFAPPARSWGRTAVSGVEDPAGGRGHSSQACGGGTRMRGREGSSDFSKPPQGLWQHPRCLPSDSQNWFFFTQRIPGSWSGGGGRGDPQLFGVGGTSGISVRQVYRAIYCGSSLGVGPGEGQGGNAWGAPCSVQSPTSHSTLCEPALGFKEQTEAQHRATQPNCPSFPQLGGVVALP